MLHVTPITMNKRKYNVKLEEQQNKTKIYNSRNWIDHLGGGNWTFILLLGLFLV